MNIKITSAPFGANDFAKVHGPRNILFFDVSKIKVSLLILKVSVNFRLGHFSALSEDLSNRLGGKTFYLFYNFFSVLLLFRMVTQVSFA
jgi:hypothetical protein